MVSPSLLFLIDEGKLMWKYILRRLVQSIPTLLGITVLSFLIITAAPGGPTAAISFEPGMTTERRERLERQLGVNDPWVVQYVHWLVGDDWRQRDLDGDGTFDTYGQRKGILRGDFGRSFFRSRRPVTDLIAEVTIPTLELTGAALLFGLLFGIPIGIFSRGSWFDESSRVMAVVFNAVPGFWLGLVLILVFGSWLEVLPLSGRCAPSLLEGCPPLWGRLEYLLLPTLVLGTGGLAGYSRYMRTAMLDVIHQDYMRTAHAKGLDNRSVWFKHGTRNALIPIATFLGPALTGLIGGAVVTESVFSWPGLGRAIVGATISLDYPFVMAVVVISGVASIVGYLISDMLYAVLDPRIRF